MHDDLSKRNRYVIPRWRPIARAVSLGEATAVSVGPPSETMRVAGVDSALADALATFDENPGIAFAAEAVAAAILAGRPEAAEEPARRVLDAPILSMGLVSLARNCINPSFHGPNRIPVSLAGDFVRSFRSRSRNGYVGSYAWLDLALAHLSIGNHGKAERALKIARGLMRVPTRLLLRAEARFYQHTKHHDRALDLLRREPEMVLADPWLLAAEIGLHRLAGKAPRNVKRALRMLKDDIAPFHLSELAAAVGTEELMAGSHKKARRLFRTAIVDPAEQGLAQTVWARQFDKKIVIPETQALRRSAEALAREAAARFRWSLVVRACREWLKEEPFASSPTIVLSGTLSVYLGDFESALEALDQGLDANPKNLLLLNNKAFILARLDRLAEAAKLLSGINSSALSDPRFAVLVYATAGLTFLRSGVVEEGRQFYRRAYDLARIVDRRDGGNLAQRVAVYFVAEARILGNLDDEIDAPMIKLANPDKLKGELAEVHKALKRYVRPPRLGREATIDGLVRNFLNRTE